MLGFRGGYQGLDPARGAEPLLLTKEFVDNIHKEGGRVLGTSRGSLDIGLAVDNLIRRGVDILFTIGGDGTQWGGNDLFPEAKKRGQAERDASGNVKFKDIGLFLRERIGAYFKAENIPVVMRYFDPSYFIRSSPANTEDSILCDLFARHAIHAAMAGRPGLVIGFLHERFIHVPIELLTSRKRCLDSNGPGWSAVLAATGQPERFEP